MLGTRNHPPSGQVHLWDAFSQLLRVQAVSGWLSGRRPPSSRRSTRSRFPLTAPTSGHSAGWSAMGAMQLCHHHVLRVAKNRKLGFTGHIRSTKFDVDWERRCFALVVSSFDKYSLLSLILIIGKICLPVLLYSFERR